VRLLLASRLAIAHMPSDDEVPFGKAVRQLKKRAVKRRAVDEASAADSATLAVVPKKTKKRRANSAAAAAAAASEDGDVDAAVAPGSEELSARNGKGPRRKRAGKHERAAKQAQVEYGGNGNGEGGEDQGEEGSGAQLSSTPRATKPSIFKKDTSFAELGLSRWIVDNCEKLGMRWPTDIQAMCIPPVIAGKNIAGNAKTGSGKTACYCLPILHYLSQDPYGVFALVVLPVRELAFQVSDNFRALGRSINVSVIEVVGGRDMYTQTKMIAQRTHIVVATPGRLADLLRGDPAIRQAFRALRYFILDEADQLLTQTFEEPLAEIIGALPKKRQTMLFSATLTGSIDRLKSRIPDLVVLDANPNDETLDNLTQEYVFIPKTVQICYLHYLLQSHFPGQSCIIFTPTIEVCQLLTTMLEILEFPVTGLHALQSQRKRQACLGKFKAGRCSILVATDVACRGLDIPKVAVVLNFGLPATVDNYVHRAGRTARAGRPGLVVSLMTEQDIARVALVEDRIGKPLDLRQTREDEAVKLLSKTTKARQKAELLLSEIGFEDQVAEHREATRKNKKARQSGTDIMM